MPLRPPFSLACDRGYYSQKGVGGECQLRHFDYRPTTSLSACQCLRMARSPEQCNQQRVAVDEILTAYCCRQAGTLASGLEGGLRARMIHAADIPERQESLGFSEKSALRGLTCDMAGDILSPCPEADNGDGQSD